jgi:hypothetical protein
MLLLAVGSARAGVLSSATWTQLISPLGGVGTIPITRTTAQLGAVGSSTSGSVSVSLAFPPLTTSYFIANTANGIIDFLVRITQGGSQVITATPSMAAGSPPISGSLMLWEAGFGITLVQVPLRPGAAGTITSYFTLIGAAHTVTVDFHAWTPRTLTFGSLTSSGVPLPSVVVMGSFNLTGNGGGTVTLVSPTKVSATSSLLPRRHVLSVTTLRLSFVPEPGSLLLAAAAVAFGLHSLRRGR